MKKFLALTILLIVVMPSFAMAQTTQGQAGQLSYTPLEPLPGVGGQDGNNFPLFVSGIFKLLLTMGALFAIVMLVVAGIGYMVSESAVDISKAKDRAKSALIGLLLLSGCWLILYTINPDLLRFDIFNTALGKLSGQSPAGPAPSSGLAPTVPLSSTDVRSQLQQCTARGGTLEPDTTGVLRCY